MDNQYLGLDLSLTGSGIVWLRDNEVLYRTTLTPPKNTRGYDRLIYIRKNVIMAAVRARSHGQRRQLVGVVEGYAYGAMNKAHDIGELGGVVRTALHEDGYMMLIVPPTTLKKFVTGAGNAKKESMLMHTLNRWGVMFSDNNQCDAYGLARFGEAYFDDAEWELTEFQRKVIADFKANHGQ